MSASIKEEKIIKLSFSNNFKDIKKLDEMIDNDVNFDFQLNKIDRRTRMVYGVALKAEIDRAGECPDWEATKAAFRKYEEENLQSSMGKHRGNIREMHRKDTASGIVKEIIIDDEKKEVRIGIHVIDPLAFEKCEKGLYCGLSIGGSYLEKYKKDGVNYYKPIIKEISLVDRPAGSSALIYDIIKQDVVKNDGSVEHRELRFEKSDNDDKPRLTIAERDPDVQSETEAQEDGQAVPADVQSVTQEDAHPAPQMFEQTFAGEANHKPRTNREIQSRIANLIEGRMPGEAVISVDGFRFPGHHPATNHGVEKADMFGDLYKGERAWDESKHPRAPAGSDRGGEFVSRGDAGGGSPTTHDRQSRPHAHRQGEVDITLPSAGQIAAGVAGLAALGAAGMTIGAGLKRGGILRSAIQRETDAAGRVFEAKTSLINATDRLDNFVGTLDEVGNVKIGGFVPKIKKMTNQIIEDNNKYIKALREESKLINEAAPINERYAVIADDLKLAREKIKKITTERSPANSKDIAIRNDRDKMAEFNSEMNEIKAKTVDSLNEKLKAARHEPFKSYQDALNLESKYAHYYGSTSPNGGGAVPGSLERIRGETTKAANTVENYIKTQRDDLVGILDKLGVKNADELLALPPTIGKSGKPYSPTSYISSINKYNKRLETTVREAIERKVSELSAIKEAAGSAVTSAEKGRKIASRVRQKIHGDVGSVGRIGEKAITNTRSLLGIDNKFRVSQVAKNQIDDHINKVLDVKYTLSTAEKDVVRDAALKEYNRTVATSTKTEADAAKTIGAPKSLDFNDVMRHHETAIDNARFAADQKAQSLRGNYASQLHDEAVSFTKKKAGEIYNFLKETLKEGINAPFSTAKGRIATAITLGTLGAGYEFGDQIQAGIASMFGKKVSAVHYNPDGSVTYHLSNIDKDGNRTPGGWFDVDKDGKIKSSGDGEDKRQRGQVRDRDGKVYQVDKNGNIIRNFAQNDSRNNQGQQNNQRSDHQRQGQSKQQKPVTHNYSNETSDEATLIFDKIHESKNQGALSDAYDIDYFLAREINLNDIDSSRERRAIVTAIDEEHPDGWTINSANDMKAYLYSRARNNYHGNDADIHIDADRARIAAFPNKLRDELDDYLNNLLDGFDKSDPILFDHLYKNWEESKHPRNEDGQFRSVAGASLAAAGAAAGIGLLARRKKFNFKFGRNAKSKIIASAKNAGKVATDALIGFGAITAASKLTGIGNVDVPDQQTRTDEEIATINNRRNQREINKADLIGRTDVLMFDGLYKWDETDHPRDQRGRFAQKSFNTGFVSGLGAAGAVALGAGVAYASLKHGGLRVRSPFVFGKARAVGDPIKATVVETQGVGEVIGKETVAKKTSKERTGVRAFMTERQARSNVEKQVYGMMPKNKDKKTINYKSPNYYSKLGEAVSLLYENKGLFKPDQLMSHIKDLHGLQRKSPEEVGKRLLDIVKGRESTYVENPVERELDRFRRDYWPHMNDDVSEKIDAILNHKTKQTASGIAGDAVAMSENLGRHVGSGEMSYKPAKKTIETSINTESKLREKFSKLGYTDEQIESAINKVRKTSLSKADDFDESEHPRDQRGRFASKGGSKKSPKKESLKSEFDSNGYSYKAKNKAHKAGAEAGPEGSSEYAEAYHRSMMENDEKYRAAHTQVIEERRGRDSWPIIARDEGQIIGGTAGLVAGAAHPTHLTALPLGIAAGAAHGAPLGAVSGFKTGLKIADKVGLKSFPRGVVGWTGAAVGAISGAVKGSLNASKYVVGKPKVKQLASGVVAGAVGAYVGGEIGKETGKMLGEQHDAYRTVRWVEKSDSPLMFDDLVKYFDESEHPRAIDGKFKIKSGPIEDAASSIAGSAAAIGATKLYDHVFDAFEHEPKTWTGRRLKGVGAIATAVAAGAAVGAGAGELGSMADDYVGNKKTYKEESPEEGVVKIGANFVGDVIGSAMANRLLGGAPKALRITGSIISGAATGYGAEIGASHLYHQHGDSIKEVVNRISLK